MLDKQERDRATEVQNREKRAQEFMNRMAVKQLLASKFAEIAFAMHARTARDEMAALAHEFHELTASTPVETPCLDALRKFLD